MGLNVDLQPSLQTKVMAGALALPEDSRLDPDSVSTGGREGGGRRKERRGDGRGEGRSAGDGRGRRGYKWGVEREEHGDGEDGRATGPQMVSSSRPETPDLLIHRPKQ